MGLAYISTKLVEERKLGSVGYITCGFKKKRKEKKGWKERNVE